MVGMQNFQDTFETRKQSFISAFSICITVTLINTVILSETFLKVIANHKMK